MKTLASLITLLALVSLANAEQGDAEDRALTDQMIKQTVTHEQQAVATHSESGYGNSGKTATQSGRSVTKENTDTNVGQ